MIQRVQTLYLLLTLAALIFLTVGTDVFVTTLKQTDQFEIISHGNVYGVQKDVYIEGELTDENIEFLKAATDKIEFVETMEDRKSTRLNSSHVRISYAVFCLKK